MNRKIKKSRRIIALPRLIKHVCLWKTFYRRMCAVLDRSVTENCPRGNGPILPKIAEVPTSGDHEPGDFFFWTNDSPLPLPPGVSRPRDVVRTRTREVQENGGKMTVFDWGRQVFFSLNYMEVRQTEGLKNWDSTVFVVVYTTQAE